MSISSLGLRTTNTTQTQAAWEVRTGSGGRPKVLECSVLQTAATVQSIGFGRPAAIGVTPVNVLFQMDDSSDPASLCNGSLSWGTSPTAPVNYERRWNSAATAGVGIIWTFPRGLIIPISSSLVIFNITVGVLSDVNCVVDE